MIEKFRGIIWDQKDNKNCFGDKVIEEVRKGRWFRIKLKELVAEGYIYIYI